MRATHLARWAAGIVVAAAVVVGTALPAAAAPGDIEYSTDGGTTWSATPPASIFPASYRMVPGDTLARQLLIRSDRVEDTYFFATINKKGTTDPVLSQGLTLAATDAAGKGLAPTPFGDIQPCTTVVPPRVLRTGEIYTINLTTHLSDTLTGTQGQDAVQDFDLMLGMGDPVGALTVNGCPVDPTLIPGFRPIPAASGEGGGLARTGSDGVSGYLVGGGVLLGFGGLFLVAARRRRKAQE